MDYSTDKRVVMTLDAGGTNFVFAAVQAGNEIINPISIPANGETLEIVLNKIIQGFNEVKAKLNVNPVAISFCFPGPAEYEWASLAIWRTYQLSEAVSPWVLCLRRNLTFLFLLTTMAIYLLMEKP